MTAARRADMLAVHTAAPAETSFSRLIKRVRLVAADARSPVAMASMPWAVWSRLIASAAMVAAAHAIGKMTVTFELSTSEADMSDEARAADAVRLGYTNQGRLVIEFLDEAGAAFAFAELTAEQMCTFVGQSCDLLEIVSKGGLATVECAEAA